MTIEAIRTARGNPAARCTCDTCGAVAEFPAKHQRGDPHGANGHALRKLTAMGWSCHGKTLRCQTCEAQRKSTNHIKEDHMTKLAEIMPPLPAELRRPTPTQKRQIIGMLEEVYDDTGKKYLGSETDKTVADAIGDGCMWGWVAEIREELFGPDGSNAEIDAVRDELQEAMRAAGALADQVTVTAGQHAAQAKAFQQKFSALFDRIEAIRRAVGPKAGK